MATNHSLQLENLMEEVLKSGNVRALYVFLEKDMHEKTHIKCSQQFVTKLDTFMRKSLDQEDAKSASLGFVTLCKCGKMLKLPDGSQGLQGLITRGLIKKWFEKCKQLWIQCGLHWDENLITLCDNFFSALMAVHKAGKEGTYKITESFLYPVGQLAIDPRIYIAIQKEAIRKYNLILDKIPLELKRNKKILTSQEASDIMTKLAGLILEGGDYDLQSSLMEALCRMATPDQRKKLADQWFSMGLVATAFTQISDSEFETACRRFLNMVNGMQGDKRRVYSYPCLEVYLDKYELLMPSDEKLEEFWIDFNLASHSISFYFSLPGEEEGHWETICISENEVQSYTVTDSPVSSGNRKEQVLRIKLSEVVIVGAVEGSSLTIHFSSSLDVLQAARSVYGHLKNKHTSVTNVEVKAVIDGNNSQVVPESQLSLGESQKNTAPYRSCAPAASAQMVTPAKKRLSESLNFICSSGGVMHSSSSHAHKLSSKDNTSVEKFCSDDITIKIRGQTTTINSKNAVAMKAKKTPVAVVAGQGEEIYHESYFVPDTQPKSGHNISSSWSKMSVSEMVMMPTQKMDLPNPEPNLKAQQESCPPSAKKMSVSNSSLVLQEQLHSELTLRLQQVLKERNQNPSPQEPALLQQVLKERNRKPSPQEPAPLQQFLKERNRKPSPQEPAPLQQVLKERNRKPSPQEPAPLQQVLKERNRKPSPQEPAPLQQVLKERNRKPSPQEPAPLQKKMTSNRKELEGTSSGNSCGSSRRAPREQQAQRNDHTKRESKDRMSLDTDPVQIKASGKPSKAKALHEKKDSRVRVETKMILSSKEKRGAEVAGSMIKLISSHHETNTKSSDAGKNIPSWNRSVNRSIFNTSWLSSGKKGTPGAVMKSYSKSKTNSVKHREDVFAFNIDSSFSIEGNTTFTTTHPVSSSDIQNSPIPLSTTKKTQPVEKNKRFVKKHLFSDTDTDNVTTEVSWLRESSRKPKPKVTKYSRQAVIKPQADPPNSSYESLKLLPPSSKAVTGNKKPSKKNPNVKKAPAPAQPKKELDKLEMVKAAAAIRKPRASGKRPSRAAATSKKSYREVNTDDSQSEPEESPPLKLRPGNIPQKTSKLKKKNILAQEQMSSLKDSLAGFQKSLPPVIEKMRSADGSAPAWNLTRSTVLSPRGSPLPASPTPPCHDTPSPILLLPKLHSTVSSKGLFKPSSFYSTAKKRNSSKIQSMRTTPSPIPLGRRVPAPSPPTGHNTNKMPAVQPHLSSVPQSLVSPSSPPLLTSTLLELDKPTVPSSPESPVLKDIIHQECNLQFSKMSSGSLVSLSRSSFKSSVLSYKDTSPAALTVSSKTEKTPGTSRNFDRTQHLASGPNRKRHISPSSNSEEDEKEVKKSNIRQQHSPRMKPRKLFKSFAEVPALEELNQVESSFHVSWSESKSEVVDGDMDADEDFESLETAMTPRNLCEQFSSELKNKFKKHFNMMELYSKQSAKTMQQHVSAIGTQFTKYRIQKLERVQKVLLEEIQNMEQSDSVLKSMEKDLNVYWKKQIVTFHSYLKQETTRHETLRTTLQNNTCDSLEIEEDMFTSEMCLIRKDMKSAQDRLLNEMLNGEVQNVKRGLHALFYP